MLVDEARDKEHQNNKHMIASVCLIVLLFRCANGGDFFPDDVPLPPSNGTITVSAQFRRTAVVNVRRDSGRRWQESLSGLRARIAR